MKKLASLTLALTALLALSGCSPVQANRWQAGNGPIKIVASTNVWGSVANLVAGDLATVDAIIYNVNQDPHSYELTARDQLLINNADIVIMNGGGYDDFMQQASDADPTPAITVNAFMASGDDQTRNEHIWYDVDQIGDVAAVIGAAIEAKDETSMDAVEKRVSDFREKISLRKAQLTALRATPKRVFLTEPLIAYLVEDAGYQNVTPAEFSNAVEEERDVPPAVLAEVRKLIGSGGVDAIFVNANTQTAQTNALLTINIKIPSYQIGELLPQDHETLKYAGDYFELLDSAIRMLEGK
ncbi:MAG: metal ABC transporter substrate-binding protein [Micrococcales bacterium]